MTDDTELDKLILSNLADLDAAAKQIEVLELRVWAAIADRMKEWAKSVGWSGGFDIEEDLWVAPEEWFDEKEPRAWFWISWGPGDSGEGLEGEAYFGLTRLTGSGDGRLCLWLGIDGIKKTAWRRAFKSAAEKRGTAGFALDDKDGLYIDCTPPLEAMIEAVVEEDYALALAPLDRALGAAHAGWRTLDKLLKSARG